MKFLFCRTNEIYANARVNETCGNMWYLKYE